MPPTYTPTTRRALRWLTGSNLVRDIDAGFQALAEDVDAALGDSGKSILTASQTFAVGATFAVAPTTPDRISGLIVPADARMIVSFSALVKLASGDGADASIFVNGAELQRITGGGVPVRASAGFTQTDFGWIYSTPGTSSPGLVLLDAAGDASTVATPLIAGQPIEIDVPAGTYDVEVRYQRTIATSITIKERRLFARVVTF